MEDEITTKVIVDFDAVFPRIARYFLLSGETPKAYMRSKLKEIYVEAL